MSEETTATAESTEPVEETAQTSTEASGTGEETPDVSAETVEETPVEEEEISYHAVEKEGHVTAIWEMQGRKHHRTIDPRSGEGKNILSLFTSEHHEEAA